LNNIIGKYIILKNIIEHDYGQTKNVHYNKTKINSISKIKTYKIKYYYFE